MAKRFVASAKTNRWNSHPTAKMRPIRAEIPFRNNRFFLKQSSISLDPGLYDWRVLLHYPRREIIRTINFITSISLNHKTLPGIAVLDD